MPQAEGPFATIICLDRTTGQQLWQAGFGRVVWGRLWPMLGGAARPATDGQRVVVHFGPWTCCLDWAGEEERVYELPEAGWADGSEVPPILAGDLCLVSSAERRRLLALDKRTGRPRWQTVPTDDEPRPPAQRASGGHLHPAPPLVDRDRTGRAAVLTASGALAAYELETGRRLWICGDLGGQTATRLFQAEHAVVAVTGGPQARWLAAQLDPANVQAGPRLLWQRQGRIVLAAAVTPAKLAYMLGDDGVLECLDLCTGKVFGQCRVSPFWGPVPLALVVAAGWGSALCAPSLGRDCGGAPQPQVRFVSHQLRARACDRGLIDAGRPALAGDQPRSVVPGA